MQSVNTNNVEVVLRNEMLLDHILGYVIYDRKQILNKEASTCKLVEHQWLNRVSVLLHKTRSKFEHQVDLLCTASKSDNWCNVEVQRFIATFENTPTIRLPSYRFHIYLFDEVATPEMAQSIETCIIRLGTGLVSLILDLPSGMTDLNGKSIGLPAMKTSLSLPYLKTLDIYLTGNDHLSSDSLKINSDFINEILYGTTQLKGFSLVCASKTLQFFPLNIKSLRLPISLNKVVFDCYLGAGILKTLMTKIFLSHLNSLTVRIPNFDISDEINEVLHQYRQQLEMFVVHGMEDVEPSEIKTTISYPIMERLKRIYISGNTHDVGGNSICSKANIALPALKKITFRYQTLANIEKWTNNYKYQAVISLDIDLDLIDRAQDITGYQQRALAHMSFLKQAFPNVTILNLTIVFSSTLFSLRFVLQQMRNLKQLGIEVYGCPNCVSPNVFNSLLIGITPEEVCALEERKNDWDCIEINYEELTSLVNLKALKKLKLSCRYGGTSKLNLDVAFQFAFSKIPTLKELSLWYRFQASSYMTQKWKAGGRILRMSAKRNDAI